MSDLRAMFVVARREFLERVRTRWFVATTLLGPLFMVAIVVVPALVVASGGNGSGTKVEVIDQGSAGIGTRLAALLREEDWVATVIDPSTPTSLEDERIREKLINGYITIDKDALEGGHVVYRGDNATNPGVKNTLANKAVGTVHSKRAELLLHLTHDQFTRLSKDVNFTSELSTGKTGEGASGTGAFIIAYILAFILYMAITLYGVSVMRSVVTEKTSRVMELMVAAVKPRALMAGKILGVGTAGLVQITIWLGFGALALAYKGTILGWFGAKGGGSELPSFAGPELVIVIAFFVFGYFFYAAMYAAVGAMVSSEQDTQQVQMPVTFMMMIGVLCLTAVTNAPRGSTATVMTNVPLWSPMLMPMRYFLGGATLGEVGISFAILVGSTFLIVRAAGKIYRTGVLMYGKRPSLGELVRWLRY